MQPKGSDGDGHLRLLKVADDLYVVELDFVENGQPKDLYGLLKVDLAAKTVARNSRILVLLNPKPLVSDVLLTAGLQTILPIVRSEQEAEATLSRYAPAER